MPDQKVVEYIKSELQKGTLESKIKTDLSANGWNANDIISAFSSLDSITPNTAPLSPNLNKLNSNLIQPQNTISPISNKKSPNKIALVSVFTFILLAAVGITYAYITCIGPFDKAPYSDTNLISGILSKISQIDSASYKASVSISVLPREDGVVPFIVTKIDDTNMKERFMRDYYRSQDITNIMNYLHYVKVLPQKLEDATSDINNDSYYSRSLKTLNVDPLTKKAYDYSLSQDGKDFELKVTFETTEAISTIKKMADSRNNSPYRVKQSDFIKDDTKISGQTVTFNKSSNTYFYLSQRPPETFFEQLNNFTQYIPSEFNIAIAF
jgi:hypothetical protein